MGFLSDLLHKPTPAPPQPAVTRAVSMIPRPYQSQGIEFLRSHPRGMLCDAPGLGKTFQACEAAVKPVIVSCPSTLADQWATFIKEQYPDDTVRDASYGDVIERHQAIVSNPDWLIINHDMWRKFWFRPVETLIIDEMHHFRRTNAERYRNLAVYVTKGLAKRVYGLTATPEYKDVTDWYAQLHLLDHTTWHSYTRFMDHYVRTINYGYGPKVTGRKNAALLQHNLSKYVLERTYKQVGMYLPDRIDKHVPLRFSREDQARYNKLRDYYRIETEEGTQRFFNAGAVLHELRKMTMTREKVEAIREIVDDTPGTSPIVIFCEYIDTAHLLADALNGVAITGEITPADRRVLARTGGPKSARVRVATMDSLSEGVDVSDARTVIFAEETYLPGKAFQAMTRVIRHRTTSGDSEPVIVYTVRYKASVDEVIRRTASGRVQTTAMRVLREALA